jgi:hypothetical protein
MVSVSLLELVRCGPTRNAWPADFDSLIKHLEASGKDDTAAWSAVSDWCREHDEAELADAFAWVAKRIGASVNVTCRPPKWSEPQYWDFSGLPASIQAIPTPAGTHETLAGTVAVLAVRLRTLREELNAW